MASHHEPFQAMGPVEWDQVPQDDLKEFLADIFTQTQAVVDSIPAASSASAPTPSGRARAKTESAVLSGDIQRGLLSQRLSAAAMGQAQELRKEWKEIKVNPRENPLAISVYKLAAKDGKGAWFARRSVHEGLAFDDWKLGLEGEFAETMKIQGSPGSGNIRGIGADKRVERQSLDDAGQLQVFQLSAQFPGPTAPRDFVTLLLTSETSTKPSDGSPPLRQFMIVSKPCQHPECPPRQGIIRGYYESVEIIREIPVENPATKRVHSSADLVRDETRRRNTGTGSDAETQANSDAPLAVEWLMVTRSDPGGSVPRFLIEKGTPPGICGDAGKFLKWVTAKSMQGFPSTNEEAPLEEQEMPELEREKTVVATPKMPADDLPIPREEQHQQNEEHELIPSSNGLYGIIAGAIGAAGSLLPTGLGLLKPFGTLSEAGSNDDIASETRSMPEKHDNGSTLNTSDDDSDTSSIRSFASALERSVTAEEEKTPESMTETRSEESRSITSPQPQQDKELQKLHARRRKLDEKVAKLAERRANKLQGEKEKDAATLAKMREKHEREVAKQEEKYRRELRKIEEKREAEQRKADERRRKAQEKEERASLTAELERTKAERDLARKQIEILEGQVGELQAQNTMLVRKLGRMGLMERTDSEVSLAKSLNKGDARVSPTLS